MDNKGFYIKNIQLMIIPVLNLTLLLELLKLFSRRVRLSCVWRELETFLVPNPLLAGGLLNNLEQRK